MHSSFCFTENGIRNRTGVAYRMYVDGKITNLSLMGKVIARDVIDIWNSAPLLRGNSEDAKILREMKLQLIDGEISNELFAIMLLAYDFGYMRGAKAMRDKLRRKP